MVAIDASPDLLTILGELLAEEGHAVTTIVETSDVFDQIATWHPDGIILDLVPGEAAGWELLDQLPAKASTATIPMLVLSTSEALLARAQERVTGNSDRVCLSKPVDLEELLQTIAALIAPP